jgi:hypothetical protein
MATGALITTRKCRFEAEHLGAARDSGLFVVANGGDASLTILDTSTQPGVRVQVGSSAEDILVTTGGDRVLVLTRLGGSQLFECRLTTGAMKVVPAPDWPMRMAASTSLNKLYVYSHFQSKIAVYNLSTLVFSHDIDLSSELGPAYSDTLNDMAFDEKASLLVVLGCEQGRVVAIDTATEFVWPVITIAPPLMYGGPGRFSAAVDASNPLNRRFFLHAPEVGRIYRFEERTGFARRSSAPITHSVAPGGHNMRTVGLIIEEYLMCFDPAIPIALSEDLITEIEGLDSKFFMDFPRRRIAYTQPVRSEAHVRPLP